MGTIGDYDDTHPLSTLVLHISAHGYEEGSGLAIGGDEISWSKLTKALHPFITAGDPDKTAGDPYKGTRILVLSACDAHKQNITRTIEKNLKREGSVPLNYIFCTRRCDRVEQGRRRLGTILPSAPRGRA